MNTIPRVPVTISLLDEAGAATMVFTFANAWPTKITGTDMKSDGNEVSVEFIEIAHEDRMAIVIEQPAVGLAAENLRRTPVPGWGSRR